jgi:hypothetical protein
VAALVTTALESIWHRVLRVAAVVLGRQARVLCRLGLLAMAARAVLLLLLAFW